MLTATLVICTILAVACSDGASNPPVSGENSVQSAPTPTPNIDQAQRPPDLRGPGGGTGELIEEREGHVLRPEIVPATEERMRQLKLPTAFRVNVFARGLGEPRMLAVGPDGTVYVTRRTQGDVLALRDKDGDGRAEQTETVVRDLANVHGIAIRDNRMYLATVNEVYVAEMKDGRVGEPRRLLGGLPPGGRHPNRTISFGPDGALYLSIGSTCNACVESSPESAAMLRVDPASGERRVYAAGLRNTIGFGWHPSTGELWGMDHGTDWLGDEFPPEELNRIEAGRHYGWPFVYDKGKVIQIKDYPRWFNPKEYLAQTTSSIIGYTAHSAPIQLVFYDASQFPDSYRGDVFVAMHGSWNRRPASGYEVVRINFEGGRPVGFEKFMTGFLVGGGAAAFGRPAGIAVARDGALLVGDDANGVIYRIAHGDDAGRQ